MTTITLEISDEVAQTIFSIIKKEGGNIISVDDDGFTTEELKSVTTGLKEARMIKNGEMKPLSMNDLWDE
ncbi:hypothetical protein [Mucilaginibacter sp. UYCu711]|uniref:hypothetical protein n=1 Tax=Mucilaginibacter sp. UYCu711 TaxID=3156339 RepID=UPI003D19E290